MKGPGYTMHIYVEWRLTAATQFKFFELMSLYDEIPDDDPQREAIAEQIKSLPGFPINAPPDSDFLLVVTDQIHDFNTTLN